MRVYCDWCNQLVTVDHGFMLIHESLRNGDGVCLGSGQSVASSVVNLE